MKPVEEQILEKDFAKKPDYLSIPETPKDIRKKIEDAATRPDFYFSKCAYEDIYYAYLRQSVENAEKAGSDISTIFEKKSIATFLLLEKDMTMHMLQDGRSFTQMACILSCSPHCAMVYGREPSQKEKWGYAVAALAKMVNPVLSIPDVMDAPPLPRFEERLLEDGYRQRKGASLAKMYYLSALKTVLLHDPSLRIQDADSAVAHILSFNGHPEDFVLKCMKESYSFPRLSVAESLQMEKTTAETERNLLSKFLAGGKKQFEHLEDMRPEVGNIDAIALNVPQENEQLVEELNKKIKRLIRKQKNIVEFWRETMDTIKDAVISFQKARTAARLLRIWCAGIKKAEDGFGMDPSEEAKKIFDEAKVLLENPAIEESEKSYEILMSHIMTLERLTNEVIQRMTESPHENPLLSLPAIRSASPLRKNMISSVPPNLLYLSAVKLAVLKNDNLSTLQADKEAARLLVSMGASKQTVKAALFASPSVSHLPSREKEAVITKNILGVQIPSEEKQR